MATRKTKSKKSDDMKEYVEAPAEAEAIDIPKHRMKAPSPRPKPERKRVGHPKGMAAPLSALPKVNIEVFTRVCGKPIDQMAGFRRWALSNKVSRKTVPEWHALWETFQARPV